MKIKKKLILATVLLGADALAVEYPIGEPVEKNGLDIAAVYLQPITMDTEGKTVVESLPADKADVHLEADIHAVQGNQNGFSEGDWIPGLTVEYTLKKIDGNYEKKGAFIAMIASDGPHYGDNIKLDGLGKYSLTYKISPPTVDKLARHIDKETGVAAWFEPFETSWEFEYQGVGRKGDY